MIPAQFEYAIPKTIPEAISPLDKNKDAKILSGGYSLIPLMRFRLATLPFLLDIKSPAGLDIGAVTLDEITTCILAELVQIHGQRIAPQAVELAQAVAVEESIVSAEVIDPICGMTVETAMAWYISEFRGENIFLLGNAQRAV